ncbi:Z1 domain-containing protein [Paenarthrobacter sp. OM7]|uniref:Z1 domain-containing protein n=1 Tax=Paenarthrobacter sp. OM7 TaxID=3041264 RepID=UPI0024695F38|nr:Z1 domain-containing protein [Paenarthrobacter sp. OM7]WGM21722.1 Z1 domain-containing protein [Paenarthrobacter sp. OM7]
MVPTNVESLGGELDEHQTAVREVADHLEGLVRGGKSIAAAVLALSNGFFKVEDSLLNAGRAEYERRRKIIQEWDDLDGTDVLHSGGEGGWYGGPKEGDFFWPPLRNRLKSELPEAFEDVDRSSSRVVDLGERPGEETIDTRGLVLGYVQSGKTTNFMSVIAKAADVGYRLIIVLSGITDNLRQQTQERLYDYLVDPCQTRVHLLTTQEQDFSEITPSEALFSQDELRLLAIVKKNPARLRRLNAWIKKASVTTLANCPILVIDDEADQASIDVGSNRQSTINNLIQELLSHPKSAYIAYTATPFANLLIDPLDESGLYPRNFVVTLPRSDDYFGPERIFGTLEAEEGVDPDDGLDVVREVPIEDAAIVKPPTNKDQLEQWTAAVPPSLRRAILWFALATTARRLRSKEIRHSSMLVHTSMRAVAHQATKTAVEAELVGLRKSVASQDPAVLAELHELWVSETQRVGAEAFNNAPISADEVMAELLKTLDSTRVLMDNYLSGDRLKYTKDQPETVIVVGGNTLSRGLTLEGLISSYFVRAASAYDTLLQMGRWFGYRKGYEDLVRVWMTTELREWFVALATVEAEIREEIDTYAKEGLKPSQLPVRIRSHPQMTITAAAKMRSAIKVNVSYSGTKVQTILFNDEDKTWLDANIQATTALVVAARASGHNEDELPSKSTRGFSGIPNDLILKFLTEYKVHEDARTIQTDTVCEYIRAQADKGALDSWNVVFVERQNAPVSDLSLGLSAPLKLLQRRKMVVSSKNGVANLKAISSRWDRFADLDYTKKSIVDSHGLSSEAQVRDYHLRDLRRKRGLDKVGLLAIYAINKDSNLIKESDSQVEAVADHSDPTTPKSERVPLNAANHLIGISLMFPEARDLSDTVDYYSARVDPDDVEDVEAELAAADDFDEKHAIQEEAAAK